MEEVPWCDRRNCSNKGALTLFSPVALTPVAAVTFPTLFAFNYIYFSICAFCPFLYTMLSVILFLSAASVLIFEENFRRIILWIIILKSVVIGIA